MKNEKLFWSKRNFIFNSKKYGWLIYAGLTNSFLSLSNELKLSLDKYLSGNENLPEDILKIFKKTGILSKYTDEQFEKFYILNWAKMLRGSDSISFTVAPTLNCNFRCTYCYEKKASNKKIMDKNILNKLLEFSKLQNKLKINIEWYGGEPLLAISHIKYFNQIARESGIELKQTMVSNGYLINKSNLEFFKDINLSGIQISLDGLRETHNKRRPHSSDSDSYSKIIYNLELLHNFCMTNNYRPFVSIRVNVDSTNADDYPVLKKYFEDKYGDFFHVYYGIVKNYNGCLSQVEDAFNTETEKLFMDKLYAKYNMHDENFFPKKCSNNYCQAQLIDNYIVDSDGFMYKCYNDIGIKERAVYSLTDFNFRNVQLESDYIVNQQVVFNKECKNCFLMYSCQGGCPNQAMRNKRICPVIKYNIEEYLEKFFENQTKKDFIY